MDKYYDMDLYRVVESVKNHVQTNKTIIQRTSNTNAVQVNTACNKKA